jgi:hypothetical protein
MTDDEWDFDHPDPAHEDSRDETDNPDDILSDEERLDHFDDESS